MAFGRFNFSIHSLQNSREIVTFHFSLLIGTSQPLSEDRSLPSVDIISYPCFRVTPVHSRALPSCSFSFETVLSVLRSVPGSSTRATDLVANFPAFAKTVSRFGHSSTMGALPSGEMISS
jgi:hypothetical protein